MQQYIDFGHHILEHGVDIPDRTGTGRRSVFGGEMRFKFKDGFPLLTGKKVFTRGILEELLWILSGDTNNETLTAKNVHIWSGWALPETTYLEDEVIRRSHRNSMVTMSMMPLDDGTIRSRFINPDGDYLTQAEHVRICRIHNDTMAHAEYDRYKVPECRIAIDIKGELGPVYGQQWRNWRVPGDGPNIDQIADLIQNLKTNPYSRRHVVTAWNPADLPDEKISPQDNVRNGKMALAACHCLFQFFVRPLTLLERIEIYKARVHFLPSVWDDGSDTHLQDPKEWLDKVGEVDALALMDGAGVMTKELSCRLDQRSADFPLGVPFNIASYALLTMMIAQCVDMVPGEFIHQFGDAHVYLNQIDTFREQLKRKPLPLPKMLINPAVKDIFAFTIDDFKLIGYESHPAMKYDVAI